MKTFSSFLTENINLADRAGLEHVIAQYNKEGEILNPDYQNLTSKARRLFEKDARHAKDMVFDVIAGRDVQDQELTDLYYAWPWDSFSSLGSFEKTLAKVEKKKFHPSKTADIARVVAAAKYVITSWKGIAANLKELKTKVVKVTAKREQAKQAAAQVMQQKFADSSSLIKIFESHLQEYKDMARKRADEFIQDKLNNLKKVGWDLEKLAPYPKLNLGRDAYMAARAKRDLYTSITSSTTTSSRPGEPDIRKPNEVMIKRYIDMNVQGAEDSYRAFMQKMIEKIGKPVVNAKMTGNIWTNAILTVETSDGEKQVWNTKMILNFSKYQKMFNQFPSRRKS